MPIFIFPIIVIIWIVLGNISLDHFQDEIGWWQDVEPLIANNTAVTGLNLMLLVFILRRPDSTNPGGIKWNLSDVVIDKKFDNFLVITSLIIIPLNIINYSSIGGITLFKDNLDGSERFKFMEEMFYSKGIVMSSALIPPLIIRLKTVNKNKILWSFLLLLHVVFAIGLGNRHFLMMPLIVLGLFLLSTNNLKARILVPGIVFFLVFSLAFSFIRGDSDDPMYESSSSFFGVEYRDYIRQVSDDLPLENGKTMLSLIFNPVPKQAFEVMNLQKDDFSIYAPYILQKHWGNDNGQRTGIWGELHLNFGWPGVLIGFILISFLLMFVTKKLFRGGSSIKERFLYSYLFSLLMFSIIGAWGTIGDDLGTYGVIYLIFALNCFKKNCYEASGDSDYINE